MEAKLMEIAKQELVFELVSEEITVEALWKAYWAGEREQFPKDALEKP